MVPAIIGLVLLIVLVIIAVRMIGMKHIPDDISAGEPAIHASGIYSIIRKSPREDLVRIRPQEQEIRKYLASLNEDIKRQALSVKDRRQLADTWRQSMEENIRSVEQGDACNVEFYYFDSEGNRPCPVCAQYINHGQFVSRQEIFKHPSVIPPFHLGCTTRIMAYHGKENLRETAARGMAPFFSSDAPPPLPQWKNTVLRT
ncbi:MAG: hypothetical protein JW699_00800 [Chitinispirillaceae bacterium]|nr:hypothetical protein [Chitinispirillaceae bacterium]